MVDEDTGAEPKILSASMTDKYLLVIRDDASAFVAEMNKDFELEEIEREDETFSSTKWATGCLYHDTAGAFSDTANEVGNVLMFLLSEAGQFHVREGSPSLHLPFPFCLMATNHISSSRSTQSPLSNSYMLQTASATSLLYCRRTTQRDAVQQKKSCPSCWWPTLATQLQNRRISSSATPTTT